jgi:hypothetical protein
VILFGLDIAHHEQDGELEHEILLYPKGCIIHGTDIGFWNCQEFAKYSDVWLIGVTWRIPASLFRDWLP